MTAEPAREYVVPINRLPPIQECSPQPIGHRNEIVIGRLGSVQINDAIIEIDIRPFHDTGLIDSEATIDHQDVDISCSLPAVLALWVFNRRRIKFFENSPLFVISQITDGLILDIPFTPFVVRRVIAEAISIPAHLIELPGP